MFSSPSRDRHHLLGCLGWFKLVLLLAIVADLGKVAESSSSSTTTVAPASTSKKRTGGGVGWFGLRFPPTNNDALASKPEQEQEDKNAVKTSSKKKQKKNKKRNKENKSDEAASREQQTDVTENSKKKKKAGNGKGGFWKRFVVTPPSSDEQVEKDDNKTNDDSSATSVKSGDDAGEPAKGKGGRAARIRNKKKTKIDEEDEDSDGPSTDSSSSNTTSAGDRSSRGDGNETASTEDAKDSNATDTAQRTQPLQIPQSNVVVLGGPAAGSMGGVGPIYRRTGGQSSIGGIDGPAGSTDIAVPLINSMLTIFGRIWLPLWIARRALMEEESIHPTQHFVWECLNDRYARDTVAFVNAMERPPAVLTSSSSWPGSALSSLRNAISQRQWKHHLRTIQRNRYVEDRKRRKEQRKAELVQLQQRKENGSRVSMMTSPSSPWTNKTVVVIDCKPNNPSGASSEMDVPYMTNVITFLLNQYHSNAFGDDLEVILLITSPGGGVSSFGLAGSQIARLASAGISTTACVDTIAASGGYMMASQATKIIAAPFAMVGSIGVISEVINFHSLMTKYGITPYTLRAGDKKNLISRYGNVSTSDIQTEQEDMARIHEDFIDLCLTQRPQLDRSSCDGSALSGVRALEVGMIDEIATSDEYIWEQIQKGHRVLKVHKTTHRGIPRRKLLSPLELLPHLTSKLFGTVNIWKQPLNIDRAQLERWATRFVQVGYVAHMVLPRMLRHFGPNNY